MIPFLFDFYRTQNDFEAFSYHHWRFYHFFPPAWLRLLFQFRPLTWDRVFFSILSFHEFQELIRCLLEFIPTRICVIILRENGIYRRMRFLHIKLAPNKAIDFVVSCVRIKIKQLMLFWVDSTWAHSHAFAERAMGNAMISFAHQPRSQWGLGILGRRSRRMKTVD